MSEQEKELTQLTIEESFAAIEELLSKMEGDSLPLDEAFELYRKGVLLVKDCSDKIDGVEKQVKLLNDQGETDEF